MALEPKVREFLNERRFAVLATINENGTPHLSTMWYRLDGDTIVMNTRRGRVKDRNLRRDRRISICVEDGARYVTIDGRVELIDDPEIAQADIHALAERYDGPESAAEAMRSAFSKQQRVTIRQTIERVDAHGF